MVPQPLPVVWRGAPRTCCLRGLTEGETSPSMGAAPGLVRFSSLLQGCVLHVLHTIREAPRLGKRHPRCNAAAFRSSAAGQRQPGNAEGFTECPHGSGSGSGPERHGEPGAASPSRRTALPAALGRCRRPPLGGTRLPRPPRQPLPRPRPRPGRARGERRGNTVRGPFPCGGAAGQGTGRWARPGKAIGPALGCLTSSAFAQRTGRNHTARVRSWLIHRMGFSSPPRKRKQSVHLTLERVHRDNKPTNRITSFRIELRDPRRNKWLTTLWTNCRWPLC